MFTSIGALLDAAPARLRRAPEPVRGGSHRAGRCEGTLWRATSRPELARIRLAAKRYDRLGRRRGQRTGPLGHVALEVLELLSHLVRYKTGRLEPSLDYLTRTLKRSRDAVVRALAALRAHGFLHWLRRFEPTGREGRGPQRRQVSNAYRLTLPARALRLLGLQGRPAPLPDDVLQAQADREAEIQALPLEDLVEARITDPWLGRLLAQMAGRVAGPVAGRVPSRDSNTMQNPLLGLDPQ